MHTQKGTEDNSEDRVKILFFAVAAAAAAAAVLLAAPSVQSDRPEEMLTFAGCGTMAFLSVANNQHNNSGCWSILLELFQFSSSKTT